MELISSSRMDEELPLIPDGDILWENSNYKITSFIDEESLHCYFEHIDTKVAMVFSAADLCEILGKLTGRVQKNRATKLMLQTTRVEAE